MGYIFNDVIYYVYQAIIFLIIFQVLLSYVLPPIHPIRVMLDRLVLPMLHPIRRVVPLIRVPVIGMIDISPIILIILVQLIAWLLTLLITILPR